MPKNQYKNKTTKEYQQEWKTKNREKQRQLQRDHYNKKVSAYLVVQHQILNLITLDQEHLLKKRSKLVSELVTWEET
jgi:predicted house-cleaning noncanonical NTP pyrophosphatase (MazG superfamily)